MFKFKLQTVLEYRKIIEEKMLLRFSEAAIRLNEEKRKLELLEQEKLNIVGILKSLQQNTTPVENIALLVKYIGALQEKENCQREIIHELSGELDLKRKELLESVQKRKIIEKLREKKLEDYHHDIAYYDRKVMDEMGITRFAGAKS
jgi:flagellar FliJ protein